MVTTAPDKVGIIAFHAYALLAVVFAVIGARYLMRHLLVLGGAILVVAMALAVLAGLWFGARESRLILDDEGVDCPGLGGFRYAWGEVEQARVARVAGWPHLAVKPRVASTSRSWVKRLAGRGGLPEGWVSAPLALADVEDVVDLLSVRRGS